MKVKTSIYERAINRLMRGSGADADMADELHKAVHAKMKTDLILQGEIYEMKKELKEAMYMKEGEGLDSKIVCRWCQCALYGTEEHQKDCFAVRLLDRPALKGA